MQSHLFNKKMQSHFFNKKMQSHLFTITVVYIFFLAIISQILPFLSLLCTIVSNKNTNQCIHSSGFLVVLETRSLLTRNINKSWQFISISIKTSTVT